MHFCSTFKHRMSLTSYRCVQGSGVVSVPVPWLTSVPSPAAVPGSLAPPTHCALYRSFQLCSPPEPAPSRPAWPAAAPTCTHTAEDLPPPPSTCSQTHTPTGEKWAWLYLYLRVQHSSDRYSFNHFYFKKKRSPSSCPKQTITDPVCIYRSRNISVTRSRPFLLILILVHLLIVWGEADLWSWRSVTHVPLHQWSAQNYLQWTEHATCRTFLGAESESCWYSCNYSYDDRKGEETLTTKPNIMIFRGRSGTCLQQV